MNKLSVLMPTYNDAEYILLSIKSILNQKYNNWEIIIVNDGSTDETETIIKSINDSRIKYFSQENSGQLNAVLHASKYIDGDIVLLFHSDDELAHDQVFSVIIESMTQNPNIDGLYADYITIDKDSNVSGVMKRPSEINQDQLIKKVFFHKGDNLIGDTFIVRRNIFDQYILPNYLYDNTIYYVDYKNFRVLNLLKINPWYKYRVFGDNYIHSDIGKFEVANGCFRTIFKLLSNDFKTGPLFIFSNIKFFKVFRKLKLYKYSRVEKASSLYRPLALKLYKLWKEELQAKEYPELAMKQIKKILHSIENKGKNNVGLYLHKEEICSIPFVFYGKDTRRFYYEYNSQTIHNIYKEILESDYDHIVVDNEKSKEVIQNILLFYSLFYDIKVEHNSNV